MISPNPETEKSTQHIQNKSFDKDNQILAFEMLGYDGSSPVRLATDSQGRVKLDPATTPVYTDELAQDAVGSILTNTGNVQFTYDDATPKITAAVDLSGKVDVVAGKGLSTNDYDDAAETKLAGIEANANNYSLPTAAAATLGGIKVGSRLSIAAGVLSADVQTTDISGKANVDQTFYIGTTQVAINRASAALTLAGLTLTTPDIGVAIGTSLALTQPANTSALTLTAGSITDAVALNIITPESTALTNGKVFAGTVVGETLARTMLYTDALGFGSGAATRDVFLQRTAANTFEINSDKAGGVADLQLTRNLKIAGDIIDTGTTSANLKISGTTTTRYLNILSSTTGAYLRGYGSTSNGLYLGAGAADHLIIDASGNVAIDTSVLFVDAVNNRVGIGTATPLSTFDLLSLYYYGGSDAASSTTRTANTNKGFNLLIPHYANSQAVISEESVLTMTTSSTVSATAVAIGGGNSSFNAATQVSFYTAANNTTVGGTERMIIDSSGNIGIGSAPVGRLAIHGTTASHDSFFGGAYGNTLNFDSEANADTGAGYVNFYGYLGGQTKFRDFHIANGKGTTIAFFDGSSGNMGLGTTSPNSALSLWGGATGGGFEMVRFNAANVNGPYILMAHSKSSTVGTAEYLVTGDELGKVLGQSYDTTLKTTAGMYMVATENHAAGACGTEIQFRTTANGSVAAPTTRMTIENDGDAYFTANVSALSFTDRTPFFDGDALTAIKGIKGKDGKIDHSTLPAFAQVKTADGEDERDLGAMISVLVKANQQLLDRVEKLEKGK